MKPDPELVMSNYRTAFQRANGCDIEIKYLRGWYRVRSFGAAIGTKHRRSEIEAFTARLNERKRGLTAAAHG